MCHEPDTAATCPAQILPPLLLLIMPIACLAMPSSSWHGPTFHPEKGGGGTLSIKGGQWATNEESLLANLEGSQ